MKLIEYLDIESIFKHVKYNQLECYPTSEEYSSELIMQDEPTYYVEDMYKFLLNPPEGVEINIKDDVDEDLIKTIFGKKYLFLSGQSEEMNQMREEITIGDTDGNLLLT